MENSPNSIEMQIDNFLEHFKRSASKAMDGDWTVSTSTTSLTNSTTIQTAVAPISAAGINNTTGNITGSGSSSLSSAAITTTGITTNALLKSRSRSSCLDISEFSGN